MTLLIIYLGVVFMSLIVFWRSVSLFRDIERRKRCGVEPLRMRGRLGTYSSPSETVLWVIFYFALGIVLFAMGVFGILTQTCRL